MKKRTLQPVDQLINNDTENNKKRQKWLDSLSGFLILYMIVYHCLQMSGLHTIPQAQSSWAICFFFMPWFFYKAGMHHPRQHNSGFYKKSFNRLLLPYIIITLISVPFAWLRWHCDGGYSLSDYARLPIYQILLRGDMDGNPPIWFLLTLFVNRILFNFLTQRLSSANVAAAIAIVTGILVGFSAHYFEITKPLYLINTFTGLAFYGLGFVMKDFETKRAVISVSLMVYLVSLFTTISFVSIHWNKLFSGFYLLWFVESLAGIITYNTLFRRFAHHDRLLHVIGKDSIIFLAFHWWFLVICYAIIHQFNITSSTLQLSTYLIIQLLMLPMVYFLIINSPRLRKFLHV